MSPYFVLLYHIKSQKNTSKFVNVKQQNVEKSKGCEYVWKPVNMKFKACWVTLSENVWDLWQNILYKQ